MNHILTTSPLFFSRHLWVFILFFSSAELNSFAQVSDLARIEYAYIPQENSENSVSRFRGLINFPIQLGWEGSYLVLGVEYRNLDLDFKDTVPFDRDGLGRFQLFRGTVGYTFKLKKDWRFAINIGAEVNSNLTRKKILNDDINFSGAIFMIKDKSGDEVEKPYRLILGLNYSTSAGRPFPLPIINYYKEFRPNWSYSVGTPKTNLKYKWDKKHALQALITLDGFFSNIQDDLFINGADGINNTAENVSMTLVLGGVGYEYFFTKNLLFYAYGGYTFFNEIRLRDSKRTNLYTINEENTYYLRTGLKFKI